jgi:hypothetical protein
MTTKRLVVCRWCGKSFEAHIRVRRRHGLGIGNRFRWIRKPYCYKTGPRYFQSLTNLEEADDA